MKLEEKVIKHSVGVAEFMSEYAKTHPKFQMDPERYYVLGLLHDIGKLTEEGKEKKYNGHAMKGGELLESLGFSYSKEVKHHGHPEDGFFSVTWMILNLADLSVNQEGERVNIYDRLYDIGMRYGESSERYLRAKDIIETLTEYAIIDKEGNILQ